MIGQRQEHWSWEALNRGLIQDGRYLDRKNEMALNTSKTTFIQGKFQSVYITTCTC